MDRMKLKQMAEGKMASPSESRIGRSKRRPQGMGNMKKTLTDVMKLQEMMKNRGMPGISMPNLKGTDLKNIIAYEEFKKNPPYLSLDELTGKKIVDDSGNLTPETAQSIMGKKEGGKVKGKKVRGCGIARKGIRAAKMR